MIYSVKHKNPYIPKKPTLKGGSVCTQASSIERAARSQAKQGASHRPITMGRVLVSRSCKPGVISKIPRFLRSIRAERLFSLTYPYTAPIRVESWCASTR